MKITTSGGTNSKLRHIGFKIWKWIVEPDKKLRKRVNTFRAGKRVRAASITRQTNRCLDAAQERIVYTNELYNPREELMNEILKEGTNKQTKCYVANLMVGGVFTTALIDTGAEVTCLSEEFINKNQEQFKKYPVLPMSGVTVKGPMGGKAVRVNKQIYSELQLSNCNIQAVFMIIPSLSRPCIISVDLLDELKCNIDLDTKRIVFPYLEGKPSIKISKEELGTLAEEEKLVISEVARDREAEIKNDEKEYVEETTEVSYEEIKDKVEQSMMGNLIEQDRLINMLWKYRTVFRRQPGRLISYEHILRVKDNRPFVGHRYSIPMAYREQVDKEIQRMLEMGIIQRSSSPYINTVVPVKKRMEQYECVWMLEN